MTHVKLAVAFLIYLGRFSILSIFACLAHLLLTLVVDASYSAGLEQPKATEIERKRSRPSENSCNRGADGSVTEWANYTIACDCTCKASTQMAHIRSTHSKHKFNKFQTIGLSNFTAAGECQSLRDGDDAPVHDCSVRCMSCFSIESMYAYMPIVLFLTLNVCLYCLW